MAHISVLYVVVGDDPQDGIWSTKIEGINIDLAASDAPPKPGSPPITKEELLKQRLNTLRFMADGIAKVTGRKYKICQYLFNKEVTDGI